MAVLSDEHRERYKELLDPPVPKTNRLSLSGLIKGMRVMILERNGPRPDCAVLSCRIATIKQVEGTTIELQHTVTFFGNVREVGEIRLEYLESMEIYESK